MLFFFFKQKAAYEMRISDWSSDVCSSDLGNDGVRVETPGGSVRARKALVCTNAYTGSFDLGNDPHRRFVPISVAVITTDEIPSGLDRPILPQGHLVTDTRNLVN